jgi:drug/metabolite transporter (DMT)-like permease
MLCAASFNIMSRRSSRSFKPAETTFFMMWFAVFSFGGIFAVRTIMAGGTDLLSRLGPASISSIVYLGILSSVVAFFFINYNLSKLKSPEAAVFANLTTLVSVIAGLAFRNESIRPTDILGGIMIIAGVWGTNVLGGKPPKVQPQAS